jgi:excisionase family DNA binding protein
MEEDQPSIIESIAQRTEMLKVKELAAILRVSVRSVYNAIENDRLPVIRIGAVIRIDPVDAAAWLSARSRIR